MPVHSQCGNEELLRHTMADDEHVEAAQQSGQTAEQDTENNSGDTNGNAQPDAEQDDNAGLTQSQAAENVPQESTEIAENHPAHDTEEPEVGEKGQSPDQDKMDVNETLANEDQTGHHHSQDLNPGSPGQDDSSNVSQNLNVSPSNVDATTSPSQQDANVDSQPDADTNCDSNKDPDIASPQQDQDPEPTEQEIAPAGQDSNSPDPGDPENTEKVPDDNVPDGVQQHPEEADSEQPKLPEQDHEIVGDSEEVTEEAAEIAPAGDEPKENQALDNDQEIAEEDVSAAKVEDVEVVPNESQAVDNIQEVAEEDASAELVEDPQVVPEGVLDEASASEQPQVQEEAIKDTPDAAEIENPSEAPPTPKSPNASANTTLDDAVQENNNNNDVNSIRRFSSGSVRIPTAQGDLEEPRSNRASPEDLRDRTMYKMRSSLPVDAYGDSKSNRLPALIHPDPRLARSLPASMDHTNIPADYQKGTGLPGANRSRSHIPRIPSASGSTKAEMRDGDVRRALSSATLPPSVLKMSTVMVSAKKRAVLNRNASVFYEEKQHSKVISLDQAINSRPPMPFDLEGPGPWSYSPRNKPLNEDNSPEYTFGHKLNEKSGGGRTAYAKTWFNSNSGFTQKVHYEKRWPSPAHYNSTRLLLGRRKPTMVDYPAFSIGVRGDFSISKRGSENEPAPNEYNRSKSDVAILKTAPSYTIRRRHQGTKLWSGNELTPGPGTYNPRWGYSSGAVHHPSFTIQGVRRLKSHQLGPHSTF